MKVSNYTVTHLHNDDFKAEYILHIPDKEGEILRGNTCILSFLPRPHLLMQNHLQKLTYGREGFRLVPITDPIRFGSWDTEEEKLQYLYNFVHDTAAQNK